MGLGWVRGIVDCSRTGGNAVGGASISPSPARQPAMPPPSHASHTFRSQDRFCISTEGRWLRSFLALQQQLSQLYQNPSPKASGNSQIKNIFHIAIYFSSEIVLHETACQVLQEDDTKIEIKRVMCWLCRAQPWRGCI